MLCQCIRGVRTRELEVTVGLAAKVGKDGCRVAIKSRGMQSELEGESGTGSGTGGGESRVEDGRI
jgi:hypothetical protein